MTNEEWPQDIASELAGFYEKLSLSEGRRETITQMRSSLLETRRWKRIAGALSACVVALVALGVFGLVDGTALPVRDDVIQDRALNPVTQAAPPVFTRTVSLEVPTMECPVNSWPRVRDTLEAEPGVEFVLLAAQKQENEINNRVVHCRC